MNSAQLVSFIDKIKYKHINGKYKCSYKNCDENSIKSHVLQKSKILKSISENNHLFQFSGKPAFSNIEQTKFHLKRVGINDSYTFPGFCKKHDTNLFSLIENQKIDFDNRKTHALFAYRAICQEIYRKKSLRGMMREIISTPNFKHDFKSFCAELHSGYEHGINNLDYFKNLLEKELNDEKTNFVFSFLEFDKVDVCISAPLNIFDNENKKTFIFDDNLGYKNDIYVTSVVNIFPYENKSYFLIATNKDYECKWTLNIFKKFKDCTKTDRLKMISDFLSTRFEFWCISPQLKKIIGDTKLIQLCKTWETYLFDFDSEINLEFNLFENYYS